MGLERSEKSVRWPLKTPSVAAPSERERLVDAMAASCAAHGYARASVEDVLERTGLDRAAFERQFSDKAECALAGLNEFLVEATRVISEARSPELTAWQRLLNAMRALLELLAAKPSYARLAYVEARQAMPIEAYDRYAVGIKIGEAMLERARNFAAASAPPTATRGAIGSGELLIRREILAGRADRLPKLLPDIIYGTVVPFVPQREALRYAELARQSMESGAG